METNDIIMIIIGIVISIIGYFMKQVLSDIKIHDARINENKVDIEILKSQHKTLDNNHQETMNILMSLQKDIQNILIKLERKKDI